MRVHIGWDSRAPLQTHHKPVSMIRIVRLSLIAVYHTCILMECTLDSPPYHICHTVQLAARLTGHIIRTGNARIRYTMFYREQ